MERDECRRLGRAPLVHDPFDDTARRSTAGVLPALDPSGRGERAEVAFDERLQRVEGDVPDEDEGEIAGVGEPFLVDRERPSRVDLRVGLGGAEDLAVPPDGPVRGARDLADSSPRS